jgi:hypothetical protein
MSQPTKQYSTAKDVFSYLLMIIMLYMGVISFAAMIWQYVNIQFPDPLNVSYGAFEIIRNSISVLFVVWPVLIATSWMIGKDLRKDKEKQNLRVRKWLMYLTLFIASMTIIVDLITLLNTFLNGEITLRFVLKALVIFVVAGGVFGYYLWDLKRDALKKTRISMVVAICTSVIFLASIVSGFFIVGSPAYQRDIRLDLQRVQDLQNIQYQLLNYWTQKGIIPQSLTELQDPISGFILPVDPLTKKTYVYQVKGPYAFELCATFANASRNEPGTEGYGRKSYPLQVDGISDVWMHAEGAVCFARSIDPELYKPTTKQIAPGVPIK